MAKSREDAHGQPFGLIPRLHEKSPKGHSTGSIREPPPG